MNKLIISQARADEQCISILRRVYKLLRLHLHHSAGELGFPANLDFAYALSKDPKGFVCPSDKEASASAKSGTFHTSYEVVNNPLKSTLSSVAATKIAIIAEKSPNHNGRRFVLFYDGFVRAFDDTQYERLKNNGFIHAGVSETTH